jgi:hypothetical protein
VRHNDWDEVDAPLRLAIEDRTGPVRAARTVSMGLNSQLAVVLGTGTRSVFVKGLPLNHPGAVRQEREAMINSHIRPVAPLLLWHEHVAGGICWTSSTSTRHGTPTTGPALRTLPRVIGAMHELAAIKCPDLPVKQPRRSDGPLTSTPRPTWTCSTAMRCCTRTSTR